MHQRRFWMSRLAHLLSTPFPRIEQRYTVRDTILYALGCGAGAEELDLVWERRLNALPTMATVLAYPGNWYARPEVDLDDLHVVHGSERIELDMDIPVEGHVESTPRIVAVHDKGPGKGALVVSRREIRDCASGKRIAVVTQRAFCRADGGIGSTPGEASPPARLPDRASDGEFRLATSSRAAAIYRLSGDDNPLHIDPEFAGAAGFPRPILHGLATYGHLARGILRQFPGRRIRSMDCRFTGPVLPGDELTVTVWNVPGGCRFRAGSGGRTVVDNGEIDFAMGI